MKNLLSFSWKRFDVLVNVKLLSLLFLIFLFSTAYTQFPACDTTSMDPSVMFSDICVLPDGQHGWVVGTTGAGGEILTSIVRMTDGDNWEQIPFPGSNSVTLGGVYFI
ncbi:MAG: hypothetical protein K8R74_12705 [Bacteroidales bacterium]|nr:hypothetical protein [Bacteroidales bacterium]